MTRYYVTFSGAKYHATTARIVSDAPNLGADKVVVLDDIWLRMNRPTYWAQMAAMRSIPHPTEGKPRGVDWFCFKPYVIRDAFERLAPGDVILYTDADTFPVADLTPLYETCVADGGVMLFGARGCIVRQWTKRDALVLMNADRPEWLNRYQAVARFMVLQKGGRFDCGAFLNEWLAYTANPLINTFNRSVLAPEHEGFQEARCEQAVLGLLAAKYDLPLYREACEFGGWGTPVIPENEKEWPGARQTFSQHGAHSYRPGFSGNEAEGSAFRNVEN